MNETGYRVVWNGYEQHASGALYPLREALEKFAATVERAMHSRQVETNVEPVDAIYVEDASGNRIAISTLGE